MMSRNVVTGRLVQPKSNLKNLFLQGRIWRALHAPALAVGALLLCLIPSTPSLARSLPEPQGRVVLTVSGLLSHHNGAGQVRFDADMLNQFAKHTIRTHTPYSSQAEDWSGFLVRDLLDYVGAKGTMVEISALDDYRAAIPRSDFEKYDVILAYAKNGKRLSIRTRGPLRVIYPQDQMPELAGKKYAPRWVWQIRKISVR